MQTEATLSSFSFNYLSLNNNKNDIFSDEPNNDGNEDCLELRSEKSWTWNDEDCALERPFICELHGRNMQSI